MKHDQNKNRDTKQQPTLPSAIPSDEFSVDAPSLQDTLASSPRSEDTVHRDSKLLGNYEIVSEIARGGMGVVYRARQINADRIVALKLIRGTDPDPAELERFQAEAKAAAKLDHPNIVPIYDVGLIAGEPFFTMKLVEGQSLSGMLDGKPIEAKLAVRIVRDVAAGIAHAHQNGIIHRDLKPGNVLLDVGDKPLVTDFGLAKLSDDESDLTRTGQAIGTPAYMPPEQASGDRDKIDHRSDIYSLGALLYACLTGRPPFQGANAMATVMAVMRDEPVSPRLLNKDVPKDLETICLKCLEKDSNDRYQAALDFRDDLQRYLAGEPVLARPLPFATRTLKWVSRNRMASSLLATSAVLMVAISIAAVSWSYNNELSKALDTTQQAKKTIELREAEANIALKAAEDANQRASLEGHYRLTTLAGIAIRDGDFRAAKQYTNQLLANPVARPGQSDPLTWETKYLRRVVSSDNALRIKTIGEGAWELASSSDGKLAVYVQRDKYDVHLGFFDPLTGIVERKITCGRGGIWNVQFNGDLTRLATSRWESVGSTEEVAKRVHVWNTDNPSDADRIASFGNPISYAHVTASKSLRWAALARNRRKTDPDTGLFVVDSYKKRVDMLPGTENLWLNDIAFSADDASAFCIVYDENGNDAIHHYSLPNWELVQAKSISFLPTHMRFAERANELVLSALDGRVYRIGTESLDLRLRSDFLGFIPNDIAISPDETLVAVASPNGNIHEVERDSLTRTTSFIASAYPVRDVCYAANGKMLWSTTGDNQVIGWRSGVSQGNTVLRSDGDGFRSVAFSQNCRLVAGGTSLDPFIYIWNAESGERVRILKPEPGDLSGNSGHTSGVFWLGFIQNDSQIASLGWDGTLRYWDIETGEHIARVEGEHEIGIQSGCMSHDERYVFSVSTDKTVGVWDLAQKRFVRRLTGWQQFMSCAVSPDGKALVAGGTDKRATPSFWNLTQGVEKTRERGRGKLSVLTGACRSFQFSPDSRYLVAGDVSGSVAVLNATDFSVVWSRSAHSDRVDGVAFSPDATRIVSAGGDGRIILWNTEDGQEILQLREHEGLIQDIKFSPDGRTIASAGVDGKVILWKTE